MSSYASLDKFFSGKKIQSDWFKFPVVLRWMDDMGMESSVKVIDNKVKYLLSQSGGVSKLKEWFLKSNDRMVTITAERYILDYVRSQNSGLKEILTGGDVDACINISGTEYGIEVTCFLETFAEWVLVERIQQYLSQNKIIPLYGLKVSAELQTLKSFAYRDETYQRNVIEQLSISVNSGGVFKYEGFSIHPIPDIQPGIISWEFEQDMSNPLDSLINDLSNKINEKHRQLNKRPCNVLFISVGSLPVNHLFPSLFAELKNPDRWKAEIIELEKKVFEIIRETSVKGVCFFVYDLRQNKPYYALKIISDDQNLVSNFRL